MSIELATRVDPVILLGMSSLVLSLVFSAFSLARAAVRGRKRP